MDLSSGDEHRDGAITLKGKDHYLVYSPAWKTDSRVRVRMTQLPASLRTHLTSPACILSFPLTSSSTPGVLFTLQSGMRTAACGSVGSGVPSWFTASARVSLIFASEARVNGAVREIMEEDGVAVINVLDNMLPFCLRVRRSAADLDAECDQTRIWKASLSLKWMPSKRPTQNVRNDGSLSLPALVSRIDRLARTTGSKTRKSVKALTPSSTEVRHLRVSSCTLSSHTGREASTSRKVAIKKIKVGQFKDGLDMSAIREVKYLRELHHPNIIEVPLFLFVSFCFTTPTPPPAHGRVLLENKPQSRPRVLG